MTSGSPLRFSGIGWRAGEPVAIADAGRRRRIRVHIGLLLLTMGAVLAFCGWIVAAWQGLLWSVFAGAVVLTTVWRLPTDVFLRGMAARPLLPDEAPGLHAAIAELCRRAGLVTMPRLYHLAEPLPLAFSLGHGEAAAIVVADCLLAGLSRRELDGIYAHEIVHLRGGDMLLKQLGFALAAVTQMMSRLGLILVLLAALAQMLSPAQFPLLSLLLLAMAPVGASLLRLALSRVSEGEADLEAAELTGDPAALASALGKIRRWEERRLRQIFPTGRILHLPTLLSDHPATEERIRRLQEMSAP